ncbi:PAS domain S-box protein [Chloroflexota bacterium]
MTDSDKTKEQLKIELVGTRERVVELENLKNEHDRAEVYQGISTEALQILNEPGDLNNSIQSILSVLKKRTGFDAVGIRLKDGDDYPYFVQEGFSEDFLLTENTLIERTSDGEMCRDKDGNISLECTCGLVVSGKTDPSIPLFTQGGSAWTSDSFPILELPPADDPRHNPRNKCIHQGFASIALIPIRNSDGIFGLIHLNDRRKGYLSLHVVQQLEGVGSHIAAAIMRKQADENLQKSEENFRRSMDNSPLGITIIGNVREYPDGDRPEILYANKAILDMYGYSGTEEINSKPLKERFTPKTVAEMEEKTKYWKLGKPILGNYEADIINYNGEIRHMEVSTDEVLWDNKRRIQLLYKDITERKRVEEEKERLINELQEALTNVKTLSGLLPICAWCKKIRDEEGFYQSVETYISKHSEVDFTHSICDECLNKINSETPTEKI